MTGPLDGPLLNTGGVPQPTQPFGGLRGPLGIDQPNTLTQMSKVKTENDSTDGTSLLPPKTEDTSNDAETKPSPIESTQSSPGISTPSSTPSNAIAVPSKPRAKKTF